MKFTVLLLLLSLTFNLKAADVERKIKITKKYLNLPVQKTQDRQQISISAKGTNSRMFVIRLADDQTDYWVFSDMTEFQGKTITVTYPQAVKGFEDIYQSDQIQGEENFYHEKNRPQVHFSSRIGWNNDPNGLVYYKGIYHLFYQHNPYEANWENMHWGHATSTDLIHWKEYSDVLYPDELGTMFSGSAVVDHNNSAGWQSGDEKTLVAAYTAHKALDNDARQTQCIAYSTDAGMTWTKYEGNPVIDSKDTWNSRSTRDPKIFWHEPIQKWVMVLFEKTGQSIYHSTDLKKWNYKSQTLGFWECPELFELPIDGDQNNTTWVMYGASGTYMFGDFDGTTFSPNTAKLAYSSGGLYAAQTYNNIPESDGRRIQMGWGRGIEHPGERFTQMMVFPTVLTLKTTPNGVRMFNQPIAEIQQLHGKSHQWSDLSLEEANQNLEAVEGDIFHIKMKIEIVDGTEFTYDYNGNQLVKYDMNFNLLNEVFYSGDENPLDIELELIVDRTSLEIYADGGAFTIVSQLEESKDDSGFSFKARGDRPIKVHNLEVHELNSIWE